ncbi:GNAT family N-acetyltransferase [Pseudodonghicola flavimaris]|uniref:N-acetyltransferase n=1 Tax=Pseudodonghicola flavimaris TaxID=3050036 RepID=A0ABT7EYY4_9RHOB|nr:N-acetyltransferase [Pseudodonghicola flavimaris]MDK3017474.1 N-acetyltransferase [Pseudodonghicola flavimaris]
MLTIRDERPEDIDAIGAITAAAFAPVAVSQQTEPAIIRALRAAGALSLSLVAEDAGEIVGHVALSPVTIAADANSADSAAPEGNWFGLGPIAVRPDRQAEGLGSRLIRQALARLTARGAAGVVLVGDPGYYRRFGFAPVAGLGVGGVPPEYVLALGLAAAPRPGRIVFHPGFDAR